MPDGDDADVEVYQEPIPNGHEIQFAIFIPNFIGRLPWYFTRTFYTDCPYIATHWVLQIKIQHVRINGTFSFFVTLRRMDSINRPVQVFFSVVSYISHLTLIPENSLVREITLPGQQIHKNFEGVRVPEELRQLLYEQLLFHVTIAVQYCHLSQEIISITGTDAEMDIM